MQSGTKNQINIELMLLTILFVIVLRNSWLSDDSYITLRTVKNFIEGYGMRWNLAERVQSFTHPLWFMVLSAAAFVTREYYYTVYFLSFLFVLLAVHKLLSVTADNFVKILIVLVLGLSRSFIDYSTSGLENCLAFFLLSLFYVNWIKGCSLQKLSFLAALCMLNRQDHLLLTAAPLAIQFFSNFKIGNIKPLIIGMSPLIIWELISLIYFGSLVPNTAYAKLSSGIASYDLIKQGLVYYLDIVRNDPLTITAILMILVFNYQRHETKRVIFSCGILLYLLYVIRIGGDFMSGRFFSVPLLCSLMLLDNLKLAKEQFYPLAVAAIIFGSSIKYPTYTDSSSKAPVHTTANGLTDERLYYSKATSLMNNRRKKHNVEHDWAVQGRELNVAVPAVSGAVGYKGFFAPREAYIVDVFALCDPFLARLKVKDPRNFRIGHFARELPDGYLESLKSGSNVIKDERLARIYEDVTLVVRGDIFDLNRWKAIYRLNFK